MSIPKQVIVLHTCDQWKSRNSMRFYGVFTGRTYLNRVLNRMLTSNIIEWSGSPKDKMKVNLFSLDYLQSNLEFINIEEVYINKEQ